MSLFNLYVSCFLYIFRYIYLLTYTNFCLLNVNFSSLTFNNFLFFFVALHPLSYRKLPLVQKLNMRLDTQEKNIN